MWGYLIYRYFCRILKTPASSSSSHLFGVVVGFLRGEKWNWSFFFFIVSYLDITSSLFVISQSVTICLHWDRCKTFLSLLSTMAWDGCTGPAKVSCSSIIWAHSHSHVMIVSGRYRRLLNAHRRVFCIHWPLTEELVFVIQSWTWPWSTQSCGSNSCWVGRRSLHVFSGGVS